MKKFGKMTLAIMLSMLLVISGAGTEVFTVRATEDLEATTEWNETDTPVKELSAVEEENTVERRIPRLFRL